MVAFNGTALLSPRTGIGTYVAALAAALENSGAVTLRYFYPFGWGGMRHSDQGAGNTSAGGMAQQVKRFLPRPYRLRRFVEQRFFNHGCAKFRPALYHEPNFLPLRFDGPKIITVHDLSCFRHPETHPVARVKIMASLLPRAIEEAAHVLTVSAFTRREVIDFFGVDPTKVSVTHLGCDPTYRQRTSLETRTVLTKLGLSHGQYVLAVGTLEPRKNLGQLLRAFERLPAKLRKTFPLVIAGMKGWLFDSFLSSAQRMMADGELRLLGYVPDEVLPVLYSGAALFAYPSIYEGFGLPPLEAMASAVPVLTSNRASLPEVVGAAGIQVDPLDDDGMLEQLRGLLEDPDLRVELGQRGMAQASSFSWQACAAATLNAYRQVLD